MRSLTPPVLRGGAAALTLLAVSPALAETYQVGPGKPYADLGAVAGLLNPGDVVEVDGDTEYPGDVVFDRPGTEAQKITIRGVRINGQRPVVRGGTNTVEAQANHYVFEGLDLTEGSFRCFYHHAHDITLRDSVIHDCPAHGILGADGDSGSLLLEYTEVHHSGEGTQNHSIYMATDETAYPGSVFRMQHCYVHDTIGGNAVKSRAERNEIYSSWIEGGTYHELELIGPDGQDPSLAREDSDVVGNVLVKRTDFSVVRFGGDGTGETNGRYRFVNNTVIVLPGGAAVFRLFDGLESVEMHNNVFAVAGGGAVNLVREVEAVWASGSRQIAGSNNWVVEGSTTVPDEWTGTLTGADPGFADLAAMDVRPREQGPLVDAGGAAASGPPGYDFPAPLEVPAWHPPLHAVEASGAATPRGAVGTIDIGAYEYGVVMGGGGSGGSGGGSGSGSGGTGAGAGSGGAGPLAEDEAGDSGGCGCRVAPRSSGASALAAALAAAALLRRRAARRRQ